MLFQKLLRSMSQSLIGNKMKLMTNKQKLKKKYNQGIAIYMAVTITAALVLVSFAIINLVLKQISISSVARDSVAAFYAADSGIECALYWDLKNPTNPTRSAFSTTTPTQTFVSCNNQSIPISVITGATTTFSFTLPAPESYCVTVGVFKKYSGSLPVTQIEARGYNSGTVSGTSCVSSSARRVERAVSVTY